MDFYPAAYRILKRENARLLRELNRAKADLKEITLWDWETDQPVTRRTTPATSFIRRGGR